MNLGLFLLSNYSHSKFFFASDGPLGSVPIFFHILSLDLTFWDPNNRDSYLGHANWSIGSWGMRKILGFLD